MRDIRVAMNDARAICLAPVKPAEMREESIYTRFAGAAGAGFPSPAQDWAEDAIDLAKWLRLDRPGSFVFRVSGNSMLDAGIFDNDILVVDRGKEPTHGNIVIGISHGGFVVRQYILRAGRPLLEARNHQMSYPSTDGDETAEIWGVVRSVVRNTLGGQ